MIRFCDKEVFNITQGEITRDQLLYFLQDKTNRKSVVAVYKKDGSYKGITTYNELLHSDDLERALNANTITISKNFWKEAKDFFNGQSDNKRLLTVTNHSGEILGFAYNDSDIIYSAMDEAFTVLERGFFLPGDYHRIQIIVITDINELAWRCYEIFKNAGFEVCVFGEKWEWFGIPNGSGYLKYPEYAKMYIYAEGTASIRVEKWNGTAYYANVYDNFKFLRQIAHYNVKRTLEEEIKRIEEKNITICECSIPTAKELDYKTKDEEQSIASGLEINWYLHGRVYSDSEMECLYRIYGEKDVRYLRENSENNVENESDIVPLGEVQGKSIIGHRHRKRIYLIGPCIVGGYGCLEQNTLYSFLQQYADEFEYQVVAVLINVMLNDLKKLFCSLPIREQDIVLIIDGSGWFSNRSNKCKLLDMKSVYEDRNRADMFSNHPIHTNPEGNRRIAKEIMDQWLRSQMKALSERKSNKYIQQGEILNENGMNAVVKYIDGIRVESEEKAETIGAIVMNANPFTKGHRYLIEFAAKTVDKLYIFVVEEDRSYFKFVDRMDMIKIGTNDLKNVLVVPSGEWVLSYKTMPIYFEKEKMQEMKVDACYDLEIFARHVAPKLGITKRFVGEEPLDMVTQKYNEQMKEILSCFAIEVVEIPRMMICDEIVSASKVREYMKQERWDKLESFVPRSTIEVCKKYKTI